MHMRVYIYIYIYTHTYIHVPLVRLEPVTTNETCVRGNHSGVAS